MKRIPLFLLVLTLFLVSCENVDLSKVSDKDLERISEKLIVCNKPYIRFGSSCCLDKDDNNICDRDERELTDEEQKEESEIIEEIPEEETVVVVEQTPKGNCYRTYGIRDNTVFFFYSNLDPHSRNMMPIVKDLENQGYKFYWVEGSDNTKKGIVDACLKHLLSGYVPQFICPAINKEKSGEITKTELKNFAVECEIGEPEGEECTSNNDCADDEPCTIDECGGEPVRCRHKLILQCINNDGCCPTSKCTEEDNDCDDNAKCEDECVEGEVACENEVTRWYCYLQSNGCYDKIYEECREGDTCKDGRCCTKSIMECGLDNECLPESMRALWCVGDDIYGEDWQVFCINPNTPESYCKRCVTNKKVGHCEGCLDGGCPVLN